MFEAIAKLFGKKDTALNPIDYGVLEVDVHSHFIPGIDDGADSIENAHELLRSMRSFGYRKVITTPHVMSDFYRNTSSGIRAGCDALRQSLEEAGIDIQIDCAAEYYCDAEFGSLIKKKDLLTFGDNYVLFELPFIAPPPNLAEAIFEMQLAGFKPVLAHPERYTFWHGEFEKFHELVDKGVMLQLNINSTTGYYSPQVKKTAQKLIEQGMISLLGSDCHHMGHINLMKQAASVPEISKLVESGQLLNAQL